MAKFYSLILSACFYVLNGKKIWKQKTLVYYFQVLSLKLSLQLFFFGIYLQLSQEEKLFLWYLAYE